MGIIKRQASRNTVINFLGAGFGALTRLSMPAILSDMQIGFITMLDAVSGLFVTIFSLGFNQVLARLFPKFRNDKNGHNGFLLFGIYLSLIGIGLGCLGYFLFKDAFTPNDPFYSNYQNFVLLIFPLIFFRILFKNLDGYASMLMNSVIGTLLEGLVSKVLFFLAILSVALGLLNYDALVLIFVASLCIPGLVIIVYSFLKTPVIVRPSEMFFEQQTKKDILNFVGFGVLLGASNSIIFYVDSLMVNKLVSLEALGVYSTYFFAARILAIPARSLSKISVVIISELWKEKDLKGINEIYRKSCQNQLIIAGFLLTVGVACLPSALHFLPSAKVSLYTHNLPVFIFLGFALLIELSTGLNSTIIGTSSKYKFNAYFNMILAVLVFIFNYALIGWLDLVGAALATLLAMFIINSMRWYFLKSNFQLNPFSTKFIISFLMVSASVTGVFFVPQLMTHPLADIAFKFIVIAIVYALLILQFNAAPDLKDLVFKVFRKK